MNKTKDFNTMVAKMNVSLAKQFAADGVNFEVEEFVSFVAVDNNSYQVIERGSLLECIRKNSTMILEDDDSHPLIATVEQFGNAIESVIDLH